MKKLKEDSPLGTFGIWRVYSDGTIRGKQKIPNGNIVDVEFTSDRVCKEDLLLYAVYDGLITELDSFLRALFFAYRVLGIKNLNSFKTDFD